MKFMISVLYKGGFPEEAAALLPAERARVKALKEQGVLEAVYLAADRSKAWFVAHNASREEALAVLETMALRPFWSDIELTEL